MRKQDIIVALLAAIVLTGCGDKKKTFPTYDGEWKDEYLKIVQGNSDEAQYALIYINDDDIPELYYDNDPDFYSGLMAFTPNETLPEGDIEKSSIGEDGLNSVYYYINVGNGVTEKIKDNRDLRNGSKFEAILSNTNKLIAISLFEENMKYIPKENLIYCTYTGDDADNNDGDISIVKINDGHFKDYELKNIDKNDLKKAVAVDKLYSKEEMVNYLKTGSYE